MLFLVLFLFLNFCFCFCLEGGVVLGFFCFVFLFWGFLLFLFLLFFKTVVKKKKKDSAFPRLYVHAQLILSVTEEAVEEEGADTCI